VILLLRLPWWGWGLSDHGPLLAVPAAVMQNAYALVALVLVLTLPVRPPATTESAPVSGRCRPVSVPSRCADADQEHP